MVGGQVVGSGYFELCSFIEAMIIAGVLVKGRCNKQCIFAMILAFPCMHA
jgi:hypothetical protein